MRQAEFKGQSYSVIGTDESGQEKYYALLKESGELIWVRESEITKVTDENRKNTI